MKLAESAVKKLLDSHAGLTALIGTSSYELMLPQSPSYPCITYYRTSTPQRMSMMGADSDIVRPIISVAAWSPVNADVKAVCAQVIACLRRYRGTVAVTSGSIEVLDIYLHNEIYSFDDVARIYTATLDFEIVHRE